MTKRRYVYLLVSLAAGAALVSCGHRVDSDPPVAREEPKIDTMFGRELVDDYYWLRERDNPEVIDYLVAENEYTEAMTQHTKELQEALFKEMKGRIKETDLSVPVKRGDYYYYSRDEEGLQYKIYCRKKGSLDAAEEVILDGNRLAKNKEFMSLGFLEVSPNHKLLAYGVDTLGSERYTLFVKDLATGELLPDVIDSLMGELEWANDNMTVFYTVPDDAWRPFRLYRHTLGDNPANDELLFEEKDDMFWLGIGKSKSQAYLFMEIGSKTTSEFHFLDAGQPKGRFRVIHPRQRQMEYKVYHHGDHFYIVTNEHATNFKLMRTLVTQPGKQHWEEVIPHREDVMLTSLDMFRDYMVLYERRDGLRQIRVSDFAAGQSHDIEFPEPVYAAYGGKNPDFESEWLRFTYHSLVTPRSVYDYHMKTRERVLRKQKEVLGGYDPDQYQSERIWARADDGTNIPISLVFRKGMRRNGTHALYLYGYGAYGASWDPYFSSNRLSLLDRGFIFAIAHVRGGGEMGRYWYDDGKLLNKANTFTDFIACADHLISEQYTSTEKLVISGGSAGGLLIGVVLNMRPDLCYIAVADVPFVDVINTMLDESIPLTALEWEEWGNPKEETYFEYMLSYSPYDNVEAKEYPHMLITAGLNDTRVQYWEPAKWTAKLRRLKTDNNRLLLKTNMGAGHGGASGRYDALRELAFEYAFVLNLMGIS